jgi:erythrin-vacuolar iron transport family protein
MKAFSALTPREILAISSEEEDARIYMAFADDLRERYPASAKVFDQMAGDETEHRHRLLELYEKRFSPKLPPIRRKDVKGFLKRRPISLTSNLSLDAMEAEAMEYQAARFYQGAAEQTTDVEVRRLLGAEAEEVHESHAQELEKSILTQNVREDEDRTRRRMSFCNTCSRPRGSHGWFSVDSGAFVRGGIRDASELANLPCWACGFDWRR